MKAEITGLKTNMIIMAITTAAIIISTYFAVPPAVIMLSKENNASTITICSKALPKVNLPAFAFSRWSSPSSFSFISFTELCYKLANIFYNGRPFIDKTGPNLY